MRTAVALALSAVCLMSTAQPIEFKGVPMGAPMDDLRAMGEWYSFSCTGDEKAEQACDQLLVQLMRIHSRIQALC